ncbi:MAG: M20 family metallopeptidase [Coriobacteriia bacterium]|nr:M20 family metallopeptidase [Coriobacteriia bacterium]MBN2840263.1 M20 family metallopeptidase [Coriobacteriia bacterium]
MNEAVALAQRLVRLNTADGSERTAAEACAKALEGSGARVEIVPMATGRAHLIASVGDVAHAPLVLSGHLDTVPFGGLPWTHGALSGDISGGMLHGRGAADMKGGVAALVTAVARHAAHHADGPGVLLVLTADEETGCNGARHLVATRQLPEGGPLLIAEPTDLLIAHGHKGVLWLLASAQGRAAHGSRPDLGRNAIVPLARFVSDLSEAGLPGSHPEMGDVTVNVGTFHGGTKVNLVPDAASAEIDIRLVAGVDSRSLLARVTALAGDGIDIEVAEDLPAVYSPADGPFASHVSARCEAVLGTSTHRSPLSYFTDASVLVNALESSEVVFLGPGDPGQAHTLDEHCPISQIEAAADLYEDVLRTWAVS